MNSQRFLVEYGKLARSNGPDGFGHRDDQTVPVHELPVSGTTHIVAHHALITKWLVKFLFMQYLLCFSPHRQLGAY